MKRFNLIFALLIAAGCSAPQVWKKDGVSLEASNKIRNQCLSDASLNGTVIGSELKQQFNECMLKNGFRRAPQWDDAPINPVVDKGTYSSP